MIVEEIRSMKPTAGKLRSFGITMGVCLSALGALLLWRGRQSYPYFFGLAALFTSLGLLAPPALKHVYKVWMSLAIVLSWVMTRVLLAVIFYVGVTPIGVLGRLLGKKFLDLGMDPGARTYWRQRKPTKPGMGSYEQQY